MRDRLRNIAVNLIFAAAMQLSVGACTSGSLLGDRASTTSDVSEKSTSARASGTKPSEDGEGVPGYLTEPKLIVILFDKGEVRIDAPAGAILPQQATDQPVLVRVFEVKREDVAAADKPGSLALPGTLHAKALAERDGSFHTSLPWPTAGSAPSVLAISVAEGNDTEIPVNHESNAAIQIAVKDPLKDDVARGFPYKEASTATTPTILALKYHVVGVSTGANIGSATARVFDGAGVQPRCGVRTTDIGVCPTDSTKNSATRLLCRDDKNHVNELSAAENCTDGTGIAALGTKLCSQYCSAGELQTNKTGTANGLVQFDLKSNAYWVVVTAPGFSPLIINENLKASMSTPKDLQLNPL